MDRWDALFARAADDDVTVDDVRDALAERRESMTRETGDDRRESPDDRTGSADP